MLPSVIHPNKSHRTNAKGDCVVNSIGNNAIADCRKCKLQVKGHIGDNAIIHSAAMPKYGSIGNNVIFHIYDRQGHYLQTRKLDSQGNNLHVSRSDTPDYKDLTPIDREENPRGCVLS
jgi:hypothetical protein